jgi:hypothetical protein
MRARRQLAAWLVVTAVGVLLPLSPAVLGLRTLSQRDTDMLYGPVRTLVVEALRAGRLPLWNPYEGMGKPLFAEGIHSVLHPVSLAGAFVAPESVDFLILAYLVTAALGAFLLSRSLRGSPPASAAGGLAFALSGYSVSMTGNLVFLAGLSTLPWLAAAARSAGAGARWGAVATAFATACAFFSGDVQVALVGLALGLLLAADAGGRAGAARAMLGMAPGLLLAGVQILATRELLPLTWRSLALDPQEAAHWALHPARLLEWVIPGLFRGPLDALPVGASGTLIEFEFADSVYLGAPLLAAAALGATAGAPRRRTRIILGVAGLACLWLALGHRLGARALLDWVPIWSRFRYAEKLMAPLALCASTLAALGIDAFGAERRGRAWSGVLLAAAATAGTAYLSLLVAPGATRSLSHSLLGDAGPFYRATLAAGLPHLLAALAALLVVDRLRPGTTRGAALALLVPLATVAALGFGAHFGTNAARQATTPLHLASDGPTPRLAHPLKRAFDPLAADDPVEVNARDVSALGVPSGNVALRVDAFEPYGAFEPLRLTRLTNALGDDWVTPLRRFGLTHVVLPVPYDPTKPALAARSTAGGRLLQRDDSVGFELWEVPHRPWASFPPRVLAVPRAAVDASNPAALSALLAAVARGLDDLLIVEADAPPPTAPGRVLAFDRRAESAWIEAESDGPSLLLVQEAAWPGWRASIDGAPTEILTADFVVRAVRWPRGRHRLEMVYDPPGVRLGLWLSAAGAVLLLALATFAALAPRYRSRATSEIIPR